MSLFLVSYLRISFLGFFKQVYFSFILECAERDGEALLFLLMLVR